MIDLHDIGVSAYKGKNIASGRFGRFLKAVRKGKIEKGSYLLVESFDRMSRQEPMVALKPFMEIVEAGLVLVTLDDERVFSGQDQLRRPDYLDRQDEPGERGIGPEERSPLAGLEGKTG